MSRVEAVHVSPEHTMTKVPQPSIRLVAGRGVEGDAHFGETVQHRSRVRRDSTQPNLRQVHLIHGELLAELRRAGFEVASGQLGENVTTRDLDLLDLPTGAELHIGPRAVVQLTGLRDPCRQLDGIEDGLMQAVLETDADGRLVRRAGVMGIVLANGEVRVGDAISVSLPLLPHRALEPV